MSKNKKHDVDINDLAKKLQDGTITEREKVLFDEWYDSFDDVLLVEDDPAEIKEKIYNKILEKSQTERSAIKPIWRYAVAVAASILIFLSVLLYTNSLRTNIPVQVAKKANIIKPGSSKAELTLADGTKMNLDASVEGEIAKQSGSIIFAKTGGELSYQKAELEEHIVLDKFNSVKTSRGGQYRIVLPDGTRVWLNAASSLKYPTHFPDNNRTVELSGEAYFEVTKDAAKPFRVLTDNQTVEVLGTHFNINAYSDENSIKTTLVEGSVKVSRGMTESRILKPGQQSTLTSSTLTVASVDTEEAIAWKNGYFIFENDNLSAIMHKIERWYDVDIDYHQALSNKVKVTGTINRDTDLKDLLALLEKTGKFKFKIEGRRIFLMR